MNETQSLLLRAIGAELFGGRMPTVSIGDVKPLIEESKAQTVYPLLFNALNDQLKALLTDRQYSACSELLFTYVIAGTQNFAEHDELHGLMTESGIPYVVLKGFASALYYPDPSLRSMGDVDFLVREEDLDNAGKAVEQAGFVVDHGEEEESKHVAYTRPPMSVWEMHRSVNGIPGGEVGERIRAELDRAIGTAVPVDREGTVCMVPDKLHHGLIMLLHTASHLTSEGVGLRHLCDWVVFASSLSDAEIRELFEKKLRDFGLWRFAQVLTLLGIRYLGAPKRVWALEAIEKKSIEEDQLEGLMTDILSGGNFGTKDMNRYRQIKYISDRDAHTVSSGGVLSQGFRTLNSRVCADFKTIDKHRILLPVGYLAEGGRYLGLLITGRRKSSGTRQMLKEAAERKKIYASMKLFRTDKL